MELLKRMNYEIVFIIATTIVAICTALSCLHDTRRKNFWR